MLSGNDDRDPRLLREECGEDGGLRLLGEDCGDKVVLWLLGEDCGENGGLWLLGEECGENTGQGGGVFVDVLEVGVREYGEVGVREHGEVRTTTTDFSCCGKAGVLSYPPFCLR